MLDQLAEALDRQDYKTAAILLKQLQRQAPDSPWVKLYGARLRELAGQTKVARDLYRQLLQESTNPKVIAKARQWLQALLEAAKARAAAEAPVITPTADTDLSFLILDTIPAELRQTAAQNLARIMNIDAYAARLLLPGRGWRLYRVGAMADWRSCMQSLNQAEVPAFLVPLSAIESIRVFRVHYLEAVSPQVSAVCENEAGQIGSLTLNWSEVVNRVEGRLPIFEEVVDTNIRKQLTRKEQTQDYAQIIDLHLPQRKVILRFCDWNYDFQQGVVFDASQDGDLPTVHSTNRIRWNQLLYFLDERLTTVPVWTEFTPFAETALEHLTLVKDFKSHIDLFRRTPSQWDQAYQLYSGLVFVQSS